MAATAPDREKDPIDIMDENACPTCGCNMYRIVDAREGLGSMEQIRQCDACQTEWTAPAAAAVFWEKRLCPACGSPNHVATHSYADMQRRKCRDCGHNFRAYERDASEK